MSKETVKRRGMTRRQALKAGAAGAAFTAAAGIGPRWLKHREAWAADLAPGMTGGPTGFAGAERYQYDDTMSEGRAVAAARKLKAEGKAPDVLRILLTDGAIGHFTKPWPADGPTLQSIWERETGIKLEFFGVSPIELLSKVMQDVTTGAASYDVYTFGYAAMGDLTEANGIVPLGEWIEKHGADFADPERGMPTPESYSMLYKYGGEPMSVCYDGDAQVWVYRKDLTEDPTHKAAFADKYGWEPGPPKTWAQADQLAEYYTGRGSPEMLGNGNMMSHFWGISTWYNRYVSKDNPNQYLFDDEGNPLINTDAGIQATEEHINSLEWSNRGGLAWQWGEYYGSMSSGNSFMLGTFSNCPKFLDTPGSDIEGKMGSFLPPGHAHGGDLVRRSTIYLGNNGGVSTQSQYQELAYLWLQWSGSTRIFSLLTGNPGGFFDPFQLANFRDPLVIQSYHDYHVPIIEGTVARAVPTLAIPGQAAMHNTLSENLVTAMTGGMTAKEAMDETAKSWKKHLRKRGEDKMIELLNASKAGWSTVVDKA